MASPMVSKLRNDLASMKMKYRGALTKARSNPKAKKGTEVLAQLSGSAVAGYVSTTPNLAKIAGFETPLVAGAGLVALAMFGKKNQINHFAGLVGIGMLNGYVYSMVQSQRGYISVPQSELESLLAQQQ